MKALVYTDVKKLEYIDYPDPTPREGERIVRVDYVGICGSDMHAFVGHDERRPAPLILGHEAAGVIMDGHQAGQRVTVNPLVSCGDCDACNGGRENLCPKRQIISMPPRPGAFAQFIQIPEQNLVVVPDDIPLDQAALCEPIACGWSAVRKAKEFLGVNFSNAPAMVIGGGAIGVGAALSLRANGVDDITLIEPNPKRCEFIRDQMGLNAYMSAPQDVEYSIIIDGVGYAATRELACAKSQPGGVIVHIGLGSADGGLDIRKMTLQDISFIGSYTYTPQDFRETAQAIFDHRLGTLDWHEMRSLDQGSLAFADIQSGQIASPKILLMPNH